MVHRINTTRLESTLLSLVKNQLYPKSLFQKILFINISKLSFVQSN